MVKDNLDRFLKSAKRAADMEAVDNMHSISAEALGEKDFCLHYVFAADPNEDDLEAISLIETEIVADAWSWIGQLSHRWMVKADVPSATADTEEIPVYP